MIPGWVWAGIGGWLLLLGLHHRGRPPPLGDDPHRLRSLHRGALPPHEAREIKSPRPGMSRPGLPPSLDRTGVREPVKPSLEPSPVERWGLLGRF